VNTFSKAYPIAGKIYEVLASERGITFFLFFMRVGSSP
jgi:hypothetical protein